MLYKARGETLSEKHFGGASLGTQPAGNGCVLLLSGVGSVFHFSA